MAFWGVEVKPGKPITLSCENPRGRLRISQATLGIGDATKKSIVQCNVGNRSPVLLCVLLPSQTESCHLDLEFEEADDVLFSVIGPRSVYLTGYYVRQNLLSNPHSDTESYGVDIENSQTEASNYCSEDDKYEDSFIDDNELQVYPPSSVSSGKVADGTTPENDMRKDRKVGGKRLKKKYQVVESDTDAKSVQSEDEDGYLLSVFKSKRDVKTTSNETGERNAQRKANIGNDKLANVSISGSKLKEKVDTVEEIIVDKVALNADKVIGSKVETCISNQNLPMSNEADQMQSLDLARPRKKRKECSKEKIGDVEIDKDHNILREDKKHGVDTSINPKTGAKSAPPPESLSENCKKLKKRRKDNQLEETHTEGRGLKFHHVAKDDNVKQDLVQCADSMTDLAAANGDQEQQNNNNVIKSELPASASQLEKKIKRRMKKKTQGEGGLNMGFPDMTNNQENTFMKNQDQTANAKPIQKRALSNGLIIEELGNGAPEGKVAAPGKKVKIFYTATLKENGHIFDSNVGKTACKFRLGGDEIIDGWNIGINGMHVGDKRRLTIPPSMGFGAHGAGENVPPNSWLVYDVELVGVHK